MKILKWLAGVVLIILLVIVATISLPAGKQPPMPSPNGYMTLLAASDLRSSWRDHESMNELELKDYVAENQSALSKAREALGQESRVDIAYAASQTGYPTPTSQIKSLYDIFVAEGKLAELENRTDDAVRSYIDSMKIGLQGTKGGPLIDGLLGVALKAAGLIDLEPLLSEMTSDDCRYVLRELNFIDQNSDSIEQVINQEKQRVKHIQSVRERIADSLLKIIPDSPYKGVVSNFQQKREQNTLALRSFLLKVAARTYELEHGNLPESIDDLVPEYLEEVPIDPMTEMPMTLSQGLE